MDNGQDESRTVPPWASNWIAALISRGIIIKPKDLMDWVHVCRAAEIAWEQPKYPDPYFAPLGKMKLQEEMRGLVAELWRAHEPERLGQLMDAYHEPMRQCREQLPHWWYGDQLGNGGIGELIDQVRERNGQ